MPPALPPERLPEAPPGPLPFWAALAGARRALRPPADGARAAAIIGVLRRARGLDDLWEAFISCGLLPGEWRDPGAPSWVDAPASDRAPAARAPSADELCALAACAPALLAALPLVEEYRLAAEPWLGESLGGATWLHLVPDAQVDLLDRHRRTRPPGPPCPADWAWGAPEAPLVSAAALAAGLRREVRAEPTAAEEVLAEGGLRWCEARAAAALLDAEAHARARRAGLRVPRGSGVAHVGLSGVLFADAPDPGRALWSVWGTGVGVVRLACRPGGPRGVVLGVPAFAGPPFVL